MNEEFGVGTSPPPTKFPKSVKANGLTSQAILTVV
jgi:hypothetical protein